MTKLSKELKDEWIEALRSDKYPQTKGSLRNSKGYDCMGVFCEIHPKISWEERQTYMLYPYKAIFQSKSGRMTAVCTIPGAANIFGEGARYIMNKLADMNDQGYTFDEIADWIENNV